MSSVTPQEKSGKFTVIGGPMFAGKTSAIHEAVQHIDPQAIRVFKPSMDTRYATDECVTHNGKRFAATNIDAQNPQFPDMGPEVTDLFIDELNFFAFAALWAAIQEQLALGRNVTGVGLLYDAQLQPFGATLELAEHADEFIQLTATCDGCGGVAPHTYRKQHIEGQVALGAGELYGPCCQTCWATLNQ